MNRLEQNNFYTPLEDKIFYPVMCMASTEPVKVKNNFFNTNSKTPLFSLNFSSFQKEEGEPYHLSFILANLSVPTPPEFVLDTVDDINGKTAIQFLSSSLEHFQNFKKAIILFENKPYTYKEFEDTVAEWKKSLEEIL